MRLVRQGPPSTLLSRDMGGRDLPPRGMVVGAVHLPRVAVLPGRGRWRLASEDLLRMVVAYLPTIPDSPELLRKSASNYGITARGKIITDILYYGNLVTLGNRLR